MKTKNKKEARQNKKQMTHSPAQAFADIRGRLQYQGDLTEPMLEEWKV